MKLTNSEIYLSASALSKAFDDETQRLPVKVGFYIQKNKTRLTELAQDIEKARVDILKEYGEYKEEINSFTFSDEAAPKVMKELEDLFGLEQEVEIYKINIDNFNDDLTLTTGQIEALMFMID